MPIYEYRCDSCGAQFEEMRRITEETLPSCRLCRSARVRKLMSLSSFHLKGGGWYVTDYGGRKNDGEQPAVPEAGADDSGPSTESAGEKGAESGASSETTGEETSTSSTSSSTSESSSSSSTRSGAASS